MLIKRRIRGILSGSTTVQWQRLWLILRLRSGLFSPGASSRRRWRWFPFQARVALAPWSLPDCHLVGTAIPQRPFRQSRCFPQQLEPTLILFCKPSFKGISSALKAMSAGRISFPFPAGSRKAGYSAHSVHGLKPGSTAMQVHIRYRTTVGYHEGSSPLHNIQSPQRPGHLLHAIGDSPSAAGAKSPSHSIHPRLGVRSRHHGVHRYAKQRIFRPFLAAGKAD